MPTSSSLDPLYGVYSSFEELVKNTVIKYNYLAEQNETLETKQNADRYLTALDGLDNFLTYRSYDESDCVKAGVFDNDTINTILYGNLNDVPKQFHQPLLEARRQRVIDEFDEQNNYYRMLDGYPDIETDENNYHFITTDISISYNIDKTIPIHKIQDYYNKQEYGLGDYFINILDGLGYIDELIVSYPADKYLNYLGSRRISIDTSRRAKNFDILRINQGHITDSIFNEFVTRYSQCREYFCDVIYNTHYRSFIDYYDNFIAMCIMVMTVNQLVMHALPNGVNRNFYNAYSVKMLYEAYNVPYDMNIDDNTQKRISQSLNLLIQNKSTDKVLYDIAEILGYSNINIYKYFLVRDSKLDNFGIPIFKYKQEFNNDTGEYETIPDYDAMYDVYFQKAELKDRNILTAMNRDSNRVDYDMITKNDTYWWDDSNLAKQVWETEYNFVESKYLGVGISYKLSEIMYENILLLRMLMDQQSPLSSVSFTLPKIIDSSTYIPIYDSIIMLCCLTCSNHHLGGEILTTPTQMISLLDYLRNIDNGTNGTVDVFQFDFSFFNGDVNTSYDEYLKTNKLTPDEYPLNKFIEDVDMGIVNLSLDKKNLVRELLTYFNESDSVKFLNYLKILSIDEDLSNADKINTINEMYTNIKGLADFINYKLSETNDRQEYETLKSFYQAAFYTKENKSLFTNIYALDICWYDSDGGYYIENHNNPMTYTYFDKDKNIVSISEPADLVKELIDSGEVTVGEATVGRAAKSYYEYLSVYNPKAYNSLYTQDFENQYNKYLTDNKLLSTDYARMWFNKYQTVGLIDSKYTFEKYLAVNNMTEEEYAQNIFRNQVKLGTVNFKYDTLKVEFDLLYFYINHIISKLEESINNLKFIYLLYESATPLEKLLMKLIRFFKSYTVDTIDLSILFVYDLKVENIVRLFDEIYYVRKDIVANDRIRMKYMDVLHSMIVNMEAEDTIFKFKERIAYESTLYLRDKLSSRKVFEDFVSGITKSLEANENLSIYDVCRYESRIVPKESLSLTDKAIVFFSE